MDSYAGEQMRRLNLLTSEIDATYHEATLKLGLTDSAMIILYTLCLFGTACPLTEIIRLSALPKQTVNSALRKLEKEEILYLEAEKGRRKRVCLTEKGKELSQNTVMRLMEIENQLFSEWPETDQELYVRLTRRFLTALREKVREL